MRVLVTGGRDYNKPEVVAAWLAPLNPTVLIHGGARGADSLADVWANHNNVAISVYAADWSRYGKAAGVIRNQIMLDASKPDVVLAFPGGRGTADMVARAKAAGIKLIEVPR